MDFAKGRVALLLTLVLTILVGVSVANARGIDSEIYWLKIKAKNKVERTQIANEGLSIESVDEDFVIAMGSEADFNRLKKSGKLITGFKASAQILDFPSEDALFHDYGELRAALTDLANNNPEIVALDSIGKSVEGRDLMRVRITGNASDLAAASEKPGIVFMGGHHAREHVSIEMPLMLAQHLVAEYKKGTPEIVSLINGRDIHIIPMVNPDGAEYDIESGDYRMWRKNRALNHDGTYGVDLNRNYSYGWGTGGSSKNPSSEVYMGPKAFSEPESQAIKNFIDSTDNLTILLSFHTYSELILYPWGGTDDPIADVRDRTTFETMAKTMSEWNGYTPEQASDLYVASGDTVDWAYGTHKIFGFTFELDPASMWEGGFYPGQDYIPRVFNKNLKPALYLIGLADNPYRANEPAQNAWGLSTPLFK